MSGVRLIFSFRRLVWHILLLYWKQTITMSPLLISMPAAVVKHVIAARVSLAEQKQRGLIDTVNDAVGGNLVVRAGQRRLLG
jgi:hypothetical protein